MIVRVPVVKPDPDCDTLEHTELLGEADTVGEREGKSVPLTLATPLAVAMLKVARCVPSME